MSVTQDAVENMLTNIIIMISMSIIQYADNTDVVKQKTAWVDGRMDGWMETSSQH